jgi:hypothetical protein
VEKNFVVPKNEVRTIPELELDAALRAVIWLKKMIELHPKIKFDEIHPAVDNSSVFIWLIYGVQQPTVSKINGRMIKIDLRPSVKQISK